MNTIYEKASETEIKKITPNEEIISLSDLKRDLQDAQDGRANLLKKQEEELANLDSYITKLETDISEAGKLNVRE